MQLCRSQQSIKRFLDLIWDQIRKEWGVRQKLQKLISGEGGLLFETGE